MPSSSAEIRLAVVVQHHPRRAHLLRDLTAALGECEVVTDPDPEGPPAPIRTYLACLRTMPEWASHICIVQDDVRPCRWFRWHAVTALRERPDSLLAFYLGGAPVRSARLAKQTHHRGGRWVRMERRDWTPTVALCWPRDLRSAFLEWVLAHPEAIKVGDDNVVGQWTTDADVPVFATVPSLVQHDDVHPSLIGRRAGAGRNRMRVAAVFADDPS